MFKENHCAMVALFTYFTASYLHVVELDDSIQESLKI